MPGFERHMRVGIAAYPFVPAIALLVHLVGPGSPAIVAAAAVALPTTLAGAMFPDLDAKRSIPFRHFRRGVALTTAVGTAVVLYVNRGVIVELGRILPVTGSPAFVAGIVYALLVVGIAWVIFRFLYVYNPPHRGVLHTVPAAVVVTSVVFAATGFVTVSVSLPDPVPIALLVGGSVLIGYLSHLFVDTDPRSGKSLLLLRETYVGKRLDERLP